MGDPASVPLLEAPCPRGNVYSNKEIRWNFNASLSGSTITLTQSPQTNVAMPDWQVFLRYKFPPELEIRRGRSLALLASKRVLVTGAGGCIGSALAMSLARSDAKEIILLDSSEGALYEINSNISSLGPAQPYVSLLASVGDRSAMTRLFEERRPEIVFHAAAFKHVPLMESNPFAAVSNNALATDTLAEAAAQFGCEQLLMVSTDKAAAPSSIMGASKRIAELILLAPRTTPLCMKAVRLGNVLGSSGSVVPLFERQIAQGGPVTVSHPNVRRYFMTLTAAVDTLLCALLPEMPTGVSVPELGESSLVLDLAKFMIGEQKVPIAFTELRPGDKMEETLLSASESYRNASDGILRPINSPALSFSQLSSLLKDLKIAIQKRELSLLLETVQRIVPEYQPSLCLSTAAMVHA